MYFYRWGVWCVWFAIQFDRQWWLYVRLGSWSAFLRQPR